MHTVDFSYLETITGGDSGFEKELLEAFLSDNPNLIKQLQAAALTGDAPICKGIIHQICPSLQLVGLVGCYREGIYWEQRLLQTQPFPQAALLALCEQIQRLYPIISQRLQTLI